MKEISPRTSLYFLFGIFILLMAYFLRIHELHSMPRGIHNDEATNILWAWRWGAGFGMPYYFDSRPEPFDGMIRAVWSWGAGYSPFAHRYFNILLSLIAVAGTAAAAREIYGENRYLTPLLAMATLALVPSHIIIGRSIYRANWVVPMSMLALALIIHMQRKKNLRYAISAGITTGLVGIFYLAGLILIPGLVAGALLTRPFWKWRRNTIIGYILPLFITMLPWLMLYLTIPNWLGGRIDALEPLNPIERPLDALQAYSQSVRSIFQASPQEFENIRYNTLTSAFLNPVLAGFALLGVFTNFFQFRKPYRLLPLLLAALAIVPVAFSGEPGVVIREVGVFGMLALLTASGMSAFVMTLARLFQSGTLIAYVMLTNIFIISAIRTNWHIQYHYKENPTVHSEPRRTRSVPGQYHFGYHDVVQRIAHSDVPIYMATDFMNENPSAWLRPERYPIVRGYDGRSLPQGELLMPEQHIGDFPPIGIPVAYSLFLPDTGEIIILPPIQFEAAENLVQNVEQTGTTLYSSGGWRIGHTQWLDAPERIFDTMYEPNTDKILAVFDNNIELLDIQAPRYLLRGDGINPVTTYWRLRNSTSQDYHLSVQPYDSVGEARGYARTWIYHWLYPTPMWQPGDVIPVTQWPNVYDDAPPGAYRFLAGLFTKPDDKFALAVPTRPYADGFMAGERVIVGRALLDEAPTHYQTPPDDARRIDAQFGEALILEQAVVEQTEGILNVELYWLAVKNPDADYTIFLHLSDSENHLIAQQDTRPQYPTGHWAADDKVMTKHQLALPEVMNCPCELHTGLYTYYNLERLPIVQGNIPVLDNRISLMIFEN